MVVKVYISGSSGNKEVKKRQQRVLLILDSRNVKYEIIDIAEPGNEEQKDFMQNKSTANGGTISDPNPRHPLPPQIFNDDDYCGDYDQFDMSNEVDEMEKFLKMAPDESTPAVILNTVEEKMGNGDVHSTEKEKSVEKEIVQDNDNEAEDSKDATAAEGDQNTKDEEQTENGAADTTTTEAEEKKEEANGEAPAEEDNEAVADEEDKEDAKNEEKPTEEEDGDEDE